MATIKYTIASGNPPFIAQLIPSVVPNNLHSTTGTFEFNNVPNGYYSLIITDSNECSYTEELLLNPSITTTTTTEPFTNSLIVGNTDANTYIFDVDKTNRNTKYDVTELYVWFKTLDGKPLTSEKIITYSFNSLDTSTFNFLELSDEVHATITEVVNGPATIINGQIKFSVGFIEAYFKYQYNYASLISSFRLNLTSGSDWLSSNIPLIDVNNQYGVTFVNNKNIIMDF